MLSTFCPLEENSNNSSKKKKRLDFNSSLGLYFSAITIYLCVKIMLNMSSKVQNDPLFNHGKDHGSLEAGYLVRGSPLGFCRGAENKGAVPSVLPLLKSGVLKPPSPQG